MAESAADVDFNNRKPHAPFMYFGWLCRQQVLLCESANLLLCVQMQPWERTQNLALAFYWEHRRRLSVITTKWCNAVSPCPVGDISFCICSFRGRLCEVRTMCLASGETWQVWTRRTQTRTSALRSPRTDFNTECKQVRLRQDPRFHMVSCHSKQRFTPAPTNGTPWNTNTAGAALRSLMRLTLQRW